MLGRSKLKVSYHLVPVVFLLVSTAILFSIGGDGEHVRIDSTHPITPLVTNTTFEVEIDETGDQIFISHLWQGISIISTSDNEYTHINSTTIPALPSDAVRGMHYSDQKLFIASGNGAQYVLDILVLYLNNMTIRILAEDLDTGLQAPLFYYPLNDDLYIGGTSGVFVLNVETATIGRTYTPTDGLFTDKVPYFQYDEAGGSLYIGTTSPSGHGIHRLDLTTGRIVTADDIIVSSVASSANVELGGYEVINLLSFFYDASLDHCYLSFDDISDPVNYIPYHLSFVDMGGTRILVPINTSFVQYFDYGTGPQPIIYDGIEIYNIQPIRDNTILLISLGDIGGGIVYTSNNSFQPIMSKVPESIDVTSLFIPSFPGGFDVAYDPSNDLAYVSFSDGIGIFDPDEPIHNLPMGYTPDDDDISPDDDIAPDDDDITPGDDDIGYNPDRSKADKIDDLIYISLYRDGDEGEEELEYDDDYVIGPNDYISASAGSWDLNFEGNLSYMKVSVVESLSGEVVMEHEGMAEWVNLEICGEDLSSSRYIIRVEGVSDKGDILFYGERDIYVENPTTVPIVGAIVGATVGVVAGVGAGIAASSMSATLSAGASSTASSTSSFSWRNLLFGLATEYTEEQLRERTGKKKKVKWEIEQFITWKEVLTMLVAVVFMVIAYAYVEMMGILAPHDGIFIGKIGIFAFPEFGMVPFLVVLPIVLFTSVVIILTIEVVEEFAARFLGLSSEMSIWPIGLLTLLISALFLMPFGYPAKTVLKGTGKVSESKEALIASLVLFTMMALLFPFGLIYMIGFVLRGSGIPDLLLAVGTVGLSICTMMLMAASLPFKPMEGRKLWNFNKGGLIPTILVALFLFWIWNFRVLIVPPIWTDLVVYIPGWIGSITLMFFGLTSILMLAFLVLLGGKITGKVKLPDFKIPKIYLFEDEEE